MIKYQCDFCGKVLKKSEITHMMFSLMAEEAEGLDYCQDCRSEMERVRTEWVEGCQGHYEDYVGKCEKLRGDIIKRVKKG